MEEEIISKEMLNYWVMSFCADNKLNTHAHSQQITDELFKLLEHTIDVTKSRLITLNRLKVDELLEKLKGLCCCKNFDTGSSSRFRCIYCERIKPILDELSGEKPSVDAKQDTDNPNGLSG